MARGGWETGGGGYLEVTPNRNWLGLAQGYPVDMALSCDFAGPRQNKERSNS
jgi:hypothetical protein